MRSTIPRVVAVPGSVTEIGPRASAVPPSAGTRYQTAGAGILGHLLFALGYVPKSEVTSLGAQAASLQAQASANAAAIASLQSELSAADASIASLNSQLSADAASISTLNTQLANLKSELAAVQASITTYTTDLNGLKSTLSGLQSTFNGLTGEITTLKGLIAADNTTISNLKATLAGLQLQVQSYTVVNAAPSFGSGSAANFVSSDVPGGPYDPGSGPYDAGFTGFAPYVGAFAGNFASLGSTTSHHAVPRFALAYAPGGFLASTLGYVPKSQAAAPAATVASLTSQVNTQNAQIAVLQGTGAGSVAAARAEVGPLTAQHTANLSTISSLDTQIGVLNGTGPGSITAANLALSGLESTVSTDVLAINILNGTGPGSIAEAKGQVYTLTLQHNGNLSTIAGLNGSVLTWQGYLSAITSGNLPVSFSWNFGDGTTLPNAVLRDHRAFSVAGGTGGGGVGGGGGTPPPPPPGSPSPSHTYTGPGTFAPALTIGVTRPDGAVISKIFALPGVLIGRWPTSATVNIANNTFYFNVTDRNGVGVANTRIRIVVYDIVGFRTGDTTVVTDVNGNNSQVGYYGSGHADGRVLRNPTLDPSTNF